MRNNHVWGTHAEIFAVSFCFPQKPVFVATNKGSMYYWAKYECKVQEDLQVTFSTATQLPIVSQNHFELCHVNHSHYEVVFSSDGDLPHTPPYVADSSTSIKL